MMSGDPATPQSGVPDRAAHMEPDDIPDHEPVAVEDAPLRALVREALGLGDPVFEGKDGTVIVDVHLTRNGYTPQTWLAHLRDVLVHELDDVGVSRIYLEEGEHHDR